MDLLVGHQATTNSQSHMDSEEDQNEPGVRSSYFLPDGIADDESSPVDHRCTTQRPPNGLHPGALDSSYHAHWAGRNIDGVLTPRQHELSQGFGTISRVSAERDATYTFQPQRVRIVRDPPMPTSNTFDQDARSTSIFPSMHWARAPFVAAPGNDLERGVSPVLSNPARLLFPQPSQQAQTYMNETSGNSYFVQELDHFSFQASGRWDSYSNTSAQAVRGDTSSNNPPTDRSEGPGTLLVSNQWEKVDVADPFTTRNGPYAPRPVNKATETATLFGAMGYHSAPDGHEKTAKDTSGRQQELFDYPSVNSLQNAAHTPIGRQDFGSLRDTLAPAQYRAIDPNFDTRVGVKANVSRKNLAAEIDAKTRTRSSLDQRSLLNGSPPKDSHEEQVTSTSREENDSRTQPLKDNGVSRHSIDQERKLVSPYSDESIQKTKEHASSYLAKEDGSGEGDVPVEERGQGKRERGDNIGHKKKAGGDSNKARQKTAKNSVLADAADDLDASPSLLSNSAIAKSDRVSHSARVPANFLGKTRQKGGNRYNNLYRNGPIKDCRRSLDGDGSSERTRQPLQEFTQSELGNKLHRRDVGNKKGCGRIDSTTKNCAVDGLSTNDNSRVGQHRTEVSQVSDAVAAEQDGRRADSFRMMVQDRVNYWTAATVGLFLTGLSWAWNIHLYGFSILRESHYVPFIFAFLYSFPYLVWNVIPWAPPWAPVCLWYAFLVQLFCTNGPKVMTTTFRIVLPLVFLLEGVSHQSFLLHLSGGELLLIAFILTTLRSGEIFHPLALLSLAIQALIAVNLGAIMLTHWLNLVLALCTLKTLKVLRRNETGAPSEPVIPLASSGTVWSKIAHRIHALATGAANATANPVRNSCQLNSSVISGSSRRSRRLDRRAANSKQRRYRA